MSNDFTELDRLLDSAESAAHGGATLVLRRGATLVYQRSVHGYGARRRQSIASATKWLTAALLLRLCSQPGLGLSLDDTVVRWLPGWGGDDPRKAGITLRMLLCHTHGLPGAPPYIGVPQMRLPEAAEQLGHEALLFEPGSGFYYGESGMQIAGAIAQAACGLEYKVLFARELSAPLGLPELSFAWPSGVQPIQPHLGGGVYCCAEDYSVFLQALYDNWQAAQGIERPPESPARDFSIAPALMNEMFADQTAAVAPPFNYTPYVLVPGRSKTRYGLGCWREEVDPGSGALLVAGSQGRMGTSPWIDFATGTIGALWVNSDFVKVTPLYDALKQAVRRDVDVVCQESR